MDLDTVLAFTLVAVVVELSPGPNFFLLVRTVPTDGVAAGFGNIGGFATAFLLHGAMASFGLSTVVAASPLLFDGIKLVGGAYLMGLGTQTLFDLFATRGVGVAPVPLSVGAAVAAPPVPARRAQVPLRSVADGFLTNLFNPKIALFYLAAFPAFVGGASAPLEAFSLVLVHTGVAVVWFSLLALAFARLVGAFANPVFTGALAALSGLVLVALGAGVVTS